eukprot:2874359-Rhodomonas_salina.4
MPVPDIAQQRCMPVLPHLIVGRLTPPRGSRDAPPLLAAASCAVAQISTAQRLACPGQYRTLQGVMPCGVA